MLKKLVQILSNKYFNIIINTLVICPLLYVIQYDWKKYHIIAMILAVFILVKELLIIKIQHFSKDITINIFNITFIFKLVKLFLTILIFYFEYRNKTIVKYNIWIAGLIYFNYIIKYIKKIFDNNNNNINKIIKINK